MRSTMPLHLVGLLGGLGTGIGCTNLLSSHCANLNGDQTCAERAIGSFCNACSGEADGCSMMKPEEGCYFPGSEGGSDDNSTVGTETAADPNLDSGMTTDLGEQCVSDAQCGEPTPVCVDGECVQCSAAESGACGGQTPVCDDATNTCVCTEHEQCGGAACNFYTHACLPANAVVHVGVGQEFINIASAVESFEMNSEGTIVVHSGAYSGAVLVGAGKTFAFLADEIGQESRWVDDGVDSVAPLIIAGGTVFLDGITLSSVIETGNLFDAPGVIVNSGRIWADRSRIVNFNGGGILASDAVDVTLRNCFVDSDGSDGDENNAVSALSMYGGVANILYSTMVAGTKKATALSCTDSSVITVRNSIVASKGQENNESFDIVCPQVDISYSAIETMVLETENKIVQMPEADGQWFVNYSAGDYHLQNDGIMNVFGNVALWQSGDPQTDIDGDPRPILNDVRDYAGADRP